MAKQNNTSIIDRFPVSEKLIQRRIYSIRGHQVMLDKDLAELYEVPTKVLNQAVKRNLSRFPNDFMFQLTKNEIQFLRSQFVTLERGRGKYSKYAPTAFTDYGVVMLSSILNSQRAIQMNIVIMKAFINLKVMLEEYKILSKEVANLKGIQNLHSQILAQVVKKLDKISAIKTNIIGFRTK